MCVDRRDLGLLLLRLGTGSVLVAHGTQKLLGWFGGPGLSAAAQGMEAMGFGPGKPCALASGIAETGGGTLLALGLGTPVAGAAAVGNLAAAASVHAPNGFFNDKGGLEFPATLAMVACAVAVAGPGRLSLDHALGHGLNRGWMVPTALGIAGAAAATVVGARERRVREKSEAGDAGAP